MAIWSPHLATWTLDRPPTQKSRMWYQLAPREGCCPPHNGTLPTAVGDKLPWADFTVRCFECVCRWCMAGARPASVVSSHGSSVTERRGYAACSSKLAGVLPQACVRLFQNVVEELQLGLS